MRQVHVVTSSLIAALLVPCQVGADNASPQTLSASVAEALPITQPTSVAKAAAVVATADDPALHYRIQPGDLLQISVWKEQDLQAEVVVRPDGGISLPLAGDLMAAGKTVSELRAEIASQVKEYMSDPLVTVSVKQAQGHKIYVLGQVNRPGEYVTNREVDVMQALSMAGGTTAYAALGKIKVLRRGNGAQQAFAFRYGDIEKGRNLEQNIVLQSGDVVVVP